MAETITVSEHVQVNTSRITAPLTELGLLPPYPKEADIWIRITGGKVTEVRLGAGMTPPTMTGTPTNNQTAAWTKDAG